MKKNEPRTSTLYVRIPKSIKELITKLSLKRYGAARHEAELVNEIFEEIRDFGKVTVKDEERK